MHFEPRMHTPQTKWCQPVHHPLRVCKPTCSGNTRATDKCCLHRAVAAYLGLLEAQRVVLLPAPRLWDTSHHHMCHTRHCLWPNASRRPTAVRKTAAKPSGATDRQWMHASAARSANRVRCTYTCNLREQDSCPWRPTDLTPQGPQATGTWHRPVHFCRMQLQQSWQLCLR